MKRAEIAFGILRIPIDILMILTAFLSAYFLGQIPGLLPLSSELDLSLFPTINEFLQFGLYSGLLLIIILAGNRLYSLKTSIKRSRELGRVFASISIWVMLIIAYFYLQRQFPFSRTIMAYSWIFTFIFVGFGRIVIRAIQTTLLKAGIGKRRIIFIGLNKITEELFETFHKDLRFKIIGVIGDKDKTEIKGLKFLGEINDLQEIIKRKKVDEIIQTKSDMKKADSQNMLDFCRENHIMYNFVPDLIQVQRSNVEMSSPSGIPIISLKPTPLDGWGKVVKRTFDIFGALFGLIVLSPFLLITALAIRIESKGTIIFKYLDDGKRVKRVGQRGDLFNFYKFRSMHPNTHNRRYTDLAEQNTRKGTPMVKIKDDPRVTKIGKFIRKWDIDELPQLWNVLIGDMSLVGPRAHLPEEVENYKNHHKFVLTIKPGITGLPQISGRSDLDFEKEIKLDTYYIENWSLWLDIKIIFKTFGVVLLGREAKDS